MKQERQLLVIIFDVNPVWWGYKASKNNGKTKVTKCLDCILSFISSYRMLRHDNEIAVIASHSSKSEFLYPSRTEIEQNSNQGVDSTFTDHETKKINSIICESFMKLLEDGCGKEDIKKDSLIAGSLALAVSFINRVLQEQTGRQKLKSRILVVKASEDDASQYMSIMNCIFAAQKHNVMIDACILGSNSGLLQQACDMTGGLYLKVAKEETFLQYLLTAFIIEGEFRKKSLMISINDASSSSSPMSADDAGLKENKVNYRAACFCHRQLVDIGFVCSVCLSIFCRFSPICSTCETSFKPPMKLIRTKKAKKRRAPQEQ